MTSPARSDDRTTPGEEQKVLFVAWTRTAGRSQEIAAALGGTAFVTHPAWLSGRRRVGLRYLVNAGRTVGALLRHRPDVVIVTNPPTAAAVVVWLWAAATGTAFALDSHPSSFGAKDHVTSQRLLPVHRFLARRAVVCMVTTTGWVDVLRGWGAHGVVVHEAPPLWPTDRSATAESGHVLFPGVFAHDEPVAEVVALARLRPEVEFHVTGDTAKCPPGLADDLPPNVRLVGYLDAQAYEAELRSASAVLALTTEPTSVMRAAYEAVYARRPLVVSDWPAGRAAFPLAVHVQHDAQDLARGIDEALLRGDDPTWVDEAWRRQGEEWTRQLQDLRAALRRPPTRRRRRRTG